MKKRNRLAYKDQIEEKAAGREEKSLEPIGGEMRNPDRPLWMPDGGDLQRMPAEVRQAVAEIVQPAYEEMVLHAATGMEKSLGASIVHLLWLEILDQYDIKKDYTTSVLLLGLDGNRKDAIDQYIRLINAKLRIGDSALKSLFKKIRAVRVISPRAPLRVAAKRLPIAAKRCSFCILQ